MEKEALNNMVREWQDRGVEFDEIVETLVTTVARLLAERGCEECMLSWTGNLPHMIADARDVEHRRDSIRLVKGESDG